MFILAAIGLCAIVYLLFRTADQHRSDNDELYKLSKYSNECRVYRDSVRNEYPTVSDETLKSEQIKILRNPGVMERALANQKTHNEERAVIRAKIKNQDDNLREIWIRDHKWLYVVFIEGSVLKPSEVKTLIKRYSKSDSNSMAEERWSQWMKAGVVKQTLFDHRTVPVHRKNANLLSPYILEGDTLIDRAELLPVREIIKVNPDIVIIKESSRIITESLIQVQKSISSRLYTVKYDGEYVYKLNLSPIYQDLVNEKLIICYEDYKEIWKEKMRQRRQA